MTNNNRTARNEPVPAVFFDRTFDETIALLLDAQGYLTNTAAGDRGGMSFLDSLRMSREISRLTARLCQIMAWLLVQKAVHAGELTPAEAVRAEHRLSGQGVCLDTAGEGEDVPPGLVDLLDRSRNLYRRVTRLDGMAAGKSSATPMGSRMLH